MGLQQKYGELRIFDTGIREATIIGQGIGLAMRGLRPIAEIQYLDYLLFGLEPLSDDVSTLHYRTAGLQSCPLIVRTRVIAWKVSGIADHQWGWSSIHSGECMCVYPATWCRRWACIILYFGEMIRD